jgi:hypothetical protein
MNADIQESKDVNSEVRRKNAESRTAPAWGETSDSNTNARSILTLGSLSLEGRGMG